MIEKFYAAHIRNELDAAAINAIRLRPARCDAQPARDKLKPSVVVAGPIFPDPENLTTKCWHLASQYRPKVENSMTNADQSTTLLHDGPDAAVDPGVARWKLDSIVSQRRFSREVSHNIRPKGSLRKSPSRDALSRILEDLSASLFPTHYGQSDLGRENIDYFVGFTLNRALVTLVEQIHRSMTAWLAPNPNLRWHILRYIGHLRPPNILRCDACLGCWQVFGGNNALRLFVVYILAARRTA
jgi:hypothetical protein